jgi:Flp pilus assembly protein TadG
MMRSLRAFHADKSGAAAVEFAMILPLLMMLTFAGLEGAHYLYVEHQVVKGVRDGARFAARQPFSIYGCGSANVSDAAIETTIKNVTRYGTPAVVTGQKPLVSTWTDAGTTVTVDCPSTAFTGGIYSSLANAPRVTVAANITYPSLFEAITGLRSSFRLHSTNQAAVVGI